MSKYYALFFFICLGAKIAFSQSDPMLSSGIAKQGEGQHDKAIAMFTESIKKHEQEVNAFLIKMEGYNKYSDFEKAEKSIEAPSIEKEYAKAYYYRGVSNAALDRKSEAEADFTVAVTINDKYAKPFYERGKLLWQNGKKFEGCLDLSAARILGDSLAIDMYDNKFCWSEAVANYKNALSSLNLKQYQKAFDLIKKSIQLSPDSAVYLVVRGRAYLGLEMYDMAMLDFDRAIAVIPNDAEARFGRGVIFYIKRKFQESFDDLNKAVQADSKFVDAYLYRAYACEGLGKISSALYDYKQVNKLDPRNSVAYYKSGLLKSENNDPQGACADFKKAAALGSAEAADYATSCK